MRDICVKLFHLIRKVHITCFCTLKIHEKTYISSSWFFISGWVRFLGRFFKIMDRFVIVSKVFWGEKQVEKVLISKEDGPWFSGHHSGRNLGKTSDVSFASAGDTSFVFFKKSHAQIKNKKGRSRAGLPWWNGQGGLAATRPSNAWPFFLLFFLFQLMLLKKINYIYINTSSLFYFFLESLF